MARTARFVPALGIASAIGVATFAAPAAFAADRAPTPTAPAPTSSTTPAPTSTASPTSSTPTSTASPTTSAPSPKVTAQAHLGYTVKGKTITISPYLTGTQHQQYVMGEPTDSSLPLSFDVTTPKGAAFTGGGNIAGDAGPVDCSMKGSIPLSHKLLSSDPLVFTVKKPGTYKFTLHAWVCTPQGSITKTITVKVPSSGSMTPTTPAPTKSAPGQPSTSAPGSTPSTPKTGPKVETDDVSHVSSTSVLVAGGLAGVAAAAGGGIALARRRQD